MGMYRLLLLIYIVLSSYVGKCQKTILAISLDNNIAINPSSNIENVRMTNLDINQTKIICNIGKTFIKNGFVTVGLGFESFGIHLVNKQLSTYYLYESRRLLLPLGLRYSVPVNKKFSICGQTGVELGLFLGGSYKFLNKTNEKYTEQKKGIFNNLTTDINLAVGVDFKLNTKNLINLSPNFIMSATNLLKDGNQLKPTYLGLRVGYAHLF